MERSRLTVDVTLPREPKQERSRRKQSALLQAARELFTDPGFEQVTADDIAAHAGYGTGTFYNYFANKTQAFLMVAGLHEPAIAPTLATVSDAVASGGPLDDVVAAVVRRVIDDRAAVPWLRRTWLRLALTDPEVAAVQQRLDREWAEAISQVIGAVVADRGVTPPAPPLAVAHTIRILVDALADEVVLLGSLTPDEAASTAGALIVGLLPHP